MDGVLAGQPGGGDFARTASALYGTRSIDVRTWPLSSSSRIAHAARGSPSFGLPTEPQLTNSTPS
jgi:hypothetical protein